jgi:hypothetical protein
LARAGELVSVMVPDERDEAIRDLSRARVDAVTVAIPAINDRHSNPRAIPTMPRF